jgi:hypothetical protein
MVFKLERVRKSRVVPGRAGVCTLNKAPALTAFQRKSKLDSIVPAVKNLVDQRFVFLIRVGGRTRTSSNQDTRPEILANMNKCNRSIVNQLVSERFGDG